MKNSIKGHAYGQAGFAPILILIAIAAVLAVGGAGYWLYQNQIVKTQNPQSVVQQQGNQQSTSTINTSIWKTYTNTKYNLSFKYPSNWFIRESSDGSSVDFSKSEIKSGDYEAEKIFAMFFVGDFSLGKEGSTPYYGTPEEFFNSYYPPDEQKNYILGTSLTREWITIANKPVFYHYSVGADKRFPFDNRYQLYTSKNHYEFILSAGTAQQPTDYEQKDNDLIRQVIGTFSLSDKSISFVNAGNSLRQLAPIEMVQYTDSSFGFSFWYPKGWNMVQEPDTNFSTAYAGGIVKKRWALYSTISNDYTLKIEEYYSPSASITLNAESGCPGGICSTTYRYYFDANKHAWMREYPLGQQSGKGLVEIPSGTVEFADVSNNTMGGLHILIGGFREDTMVVPLSAHNFVVVSDMPWNVGPNFKINLVRTIIATDPSVAIPVSVAEQVRIIQEEKDNFVGIAKQARVIEP